MRQIGGEPELFLKENIFYTDSGRSSIRVFFKNIQGKVLIPDFLCEVISETLKKENIEYDYYHINEDLSIDFNTVKNFDILYVINYFGIKQKIDINLDNKYLIEDNVFFYDFENKGFKNWFSFNSYRKVTHLADGSLIKTNLDIKFKQENRNLFSDSKYKAKKIKYDFIFNNKWLERDYLKLFKKAESILDNQSEIFSISDKSIYLLSLYNVKYYQDIRKKRFEKLLNELGDFCINKNPEFYSFFVIKIDNRDKFRKMLFQKNIFFPIHWPNNEVDNILYDKVISIPLFENYDEKDFEYLIASIKEVLYKL